MRYIYNYAAFSQNPLSNELKLSRDQNIEIDFKVCRNSNYTGFQVLQLVGIGNNVPPIQNTNLEKPVYTSEINGTREIIYNVKWESRDDYCKIATAKVEGATVQNGTVFKCGLFPNQNSTFHVIIGEVIIIIVEQQGMFKIQNRLLVYCTFVLIGRGQILMGLSSRNCHTILGNSAFSNIIIPIIHAVRTKARIMSTH